MKLINIEVLDKNPNTQDEISKEMQEILWIGGC